MAASVKAGAALSRASARSLRRYRAARRIGTHLVLLLCGGLFMAPFYWLLSTSFKVSDDLFATPTVWIPTRLTLDNYAQALTFVPYGQYLANTLYISLFAVVATLASCSLVAYGFSRLEWPGRDLFFVVTLATMMLPYPVTLVPTFIVFKWLHWIGTFNPLTWPNFTGNPFFIFLLRQFF